MTNQMDKNSSSCSQCGRNYPIDDLIKFENLLVCYKCKHIFLQKIREGVNLDNKQSRSRWWKIYFFILLFFAIIGYIGILKDFISGKNIITGIIDFIVGPFVLAAVFGYAFNKKILNRKLWKILFPVNIIVDVIEIYQMFSTKGNTEEITGIVIASIFFSPILILQYVALYKYAFSKIEPWE